jgi:PIN domain nuclease of toxin-antitoxin system
MDLLLDTHAAVWWAENPLLLSVEASTALADRINTVWFSSASAWELAIKIKTGKLTLDVVSLVDQLTQNGIRILGIGIDDAIAAGSLDWLHRDPFDRMLVAQAQRLTMLLVTRDEIIQTFLSSQTIAC